MLAPARGRADFIFQDLTTFNLGTFDGPTDLTFSPSAINQFNTSLGNLTDVDIYTA